MFIYILLSVELAPIQGMHDAKTSLFSLIRTHKVILYRKTRSLLNAHRLDIFSTNVLFYSEVTTSLEFQKSDRLK